MMPALLLPTAAPRRGPPRVAAGRSAARAAPRRGAAGRRAPARQGAASHPQDRRPPTPPLAGRLTASATSCCCTPACRSRSILRRSASAARTSRCRDAQLLDLQAEPIERFPQCLNLSSVQGDRPPAGASGKLFAIAPRSGPASRVTGWHLPARSTCHHRSRRRRDLLASTSASMDPRRRVKRGESIAAVGCGGHARACVGCSRCWPTP